MKISIITINYNNVKGLRNTIESVMKQTFHDYEYILIDGGSTDGSVDEIKKVADKLSYWISEPDNGVYHAMNKGIASAKGEYLLFLNSGDRLVDDQVLEQVSAELNGEGIVYGDGILETSDGKFVRMKIPATLNLPYFTTASLFHPSAFIQSALFQKYGLYNEHNKIVSDWEFFLKTLIINNTSRKKISSLISVIEDGGISRKVENNGLLMQEVNKTLEKYFSDSVISALREQLQLKNEKKQQKRSIFIRFRDLLLNQKNKLK